MGPKSHQVEKANAAEGQEEPEEPEELEEDLRIIRNRMKM